MRTRKVVVLPYDVIWQSAFDKIKGEIEVAIPKILYPNLKLPSKKQMKRVIGLNFYIGQSISMSKLSNYYPQNAPL